MVQYESLTKLLYILGLSIDEFSRNKLDLTAKELSEEKDLAYSCLSQFCLAEKKVAFVVGIEVAAVLNNAIVICCLIINGETTTSLQLFKNTLLCLRDIFLINRLYDRRKIMYAQHFDGKSSFEHIWSWKIYFLFQRKRKFIYFFYNSFVKV